MKNFKLLYKLGAGCFIVILFFFSLKKLVLACDTCADGWEDWGGVCVKGKGCPSWVCSWANIEVCSWQGGYTCLGWKTVCAETWCGYRGGYGYGCYCVRTFSHQYPYLCSKLICHDEVKEVSCKGQCYLCPTPPPPPPTPACQVNSTYDLNVYVKNAEGGCGSLGGAEGDALVTVYNDSGGNLGSQIFSGNTDSEGKVLLDDISTSNSTLYFQASKVVEGENPVTYQLLCPNPSIYKTTLSPVACDEKSVTLGITPLDKASWKTVIDGDIFASQIGIDVPEGLYVIRENGTKRHIS